MMTIIYISSEYPPVTGNGGIGTYTKYSAEGMFKQGHKVYVICRNPENSAQRQTINGVNIHRIPPSDFTLPKARYLFYYRVIIRKLFYHSLVRIAWAHAVRNELIYIKNRERNIDIIEYPECGAEGLLIPNFLKTCKIVRLHTPWSMVKKLDNIKEQPGDELIFPFLEKHTIRKAHYISSPSYAMIHSLPWKLSKSKTIVIPNPIAINQFKKSKGNGWVYIGRVERRKGVHTLIKSYFKLCSTHNPPNLTVAGPPYGKNKSGISYETEINKLINHSRFSKKIIWYKGLPQEKIHLLLQESSVAFCPSLWENFPYACLEAMSFGCAVIASNCGGFPEIIQHNVNGILVSPSSPDKLAEAMKYLIQNSQKIRKLGNAASTFVTTHFNSELICSKMESLYCTAIEGYKYEKK